MINIMVYQIAIFMDGCSFILDGLIEKEIRIMEFFIGLLFGVAGCVIATIPAEKDYGQLMYIRGYNKALEDMEKKRNGEEKQRI